VGTAHQKKDFQTFFWKKESLLIGLYVFLTFWRVGLNGAHPAKETMSQKTSISIASGN
jgi:hypothetical protein